MGQKLPRTAFTASVYSAAQNQDEAAIRKAEASLEEAWNLHDATAFAGFFTEDADCVNVVGWWWKGRAEIEARVADSHLSMFRESRITNHEVHIRFLTPRIALVHVRWSMVGNRNPDGTPGRPRRGIQTHVLQEAAGEWLIASFKNVDSIPEKPLLIGPPAP